VEGRVVREAEVRVVNEVEEVKEVKEVKEEGGRAEHLATERVEKRKKEIGKGKADPSLRPAKGAGLRSG
jgi:hypothetical protein